jgi:heat shock protein HtpX
VWELVRANQRRAAALVVLMAGLLLVAGFAVGEAFAQGAGAVGLLAAFVVWLVLTLVSYSSGDSILLSLAGARKIEKKDNPVLFNVVEEMCLAAGIAKLPDIYVIDDAAPNAFATGRGPDRAALAVTAGLLETLDRNELQGVVAHELGHVRNRDVLYLMMVGIMMGTIVLLADLGTRALFYGGGRRRTSTRGGGQGQLVVLLVALVLMILAPILAQLIYFAVSRRREYLADACSALYTRYPEGLASALEKISRTTVTLRSASRATAPMFIVNPLGATSRGLADLTSTHPSISERVRILRSMAGGAGLARYDEAFRKVTGRAVGVVPRASREAAAEAAATAPAAADTTARLEKVRRTTDMLWRLNRYVFVACGCGTTLKIPPVYLGREIACPHCGAPHRVEPAAAA